MKMRARQAERLKAAAPQLYGLLEAIWSKSRQLFVIAALLLLEFELRDSKSPGVIDIAKANSADAISGTSGRISVIRIAPDNKSLLPACALVFARSAWFGCRVGILHMRRRAMHFLARLTHRTAVHHPIY